MPVTLLPFRLLPAVYLQRNTITISLPSLSVPPADFLSVPSQSRNTSPWMDASPRNQYRSLLFLDRSPVAATPEGQVMKGYDTALYQIRTIVEAELRASILCDRLLGLFRTISSDDIDEQLPEAFKRCRHDEEAVEILVAAANLGSVRAFEYLLSLRGMCSDDERQQTAVSPGWGLHFHIAAKRARRYFTFKIDPLWLMAPMMKGDLNAIRVLKKVILAQDSSFWLICSAEETDHELIESRDVWIALCNMATSPREAIQMLSEIVMNSPSKHAREIAFQALKFKAHGSLQSEACEAAVESLADFAMGGNRKAFYYLLKAWKKTSPEDMAPFFETLVRSGLFLEEIAEYLFQSCSRDCQGYQSIHTAVGGKPLSIESKLAFSLYSPIFERFAEMHPIIDARYRGFLKWLDDGGRSLN